MILLGLFCFVVLPVFTLMPFMNTWVLKNGKLSALVKRELHSNSEKTSKLSFISHVLAYQLTIYHGVYELYLWIGFITWQWQMIEEDICPCQMTD